MAANVSRRGAPLTRESKAMPRYYVHLCRVVVENCHIEVDADDKDSAFALAVDRAGDSDMTAWEWGD